METKITEIWKDVPTSDRYRVSNTGKVWDNRKLSFVDQKRHKSGYFHVNIKVLPRVTHCISVHRLVLWAFSDIFTSVYLQCNHIDGDKANNNLSNLEAVTPAENTNHAYKIGLNPGAWFNYKKKFGVWSDQQRAKREQKPNKYDHLRK